MASVVLSIIFALNMLPKTGYRVDDSAIIIYSGSVICPILRFTTSQLRFGEVAFG